MLEEYLSRGLFRLLILKKNNFIFLSKNIKYKNTLAPLFLNFLIILSNIDRHDFIFHKNKLDFFKNHSNYDLSILMGIATVEYNKEQKLFFNRTNNKYLIIRKFLKRIKLKTLNKTSILDLILKKFIEKHTANKVSMNFDKYSLSFFKRKTIYLRLIRRKLRRMKKMLK